jgi:hypothetical protein
MKIRTIETLTFLLTVPYIAWETSQNSETEYYQNLEEIRWFRESMEEDLYKLQKMARNETNEDNRRALTFLYYLAKSISESSIEGITKSFHFASWVRTKINSSERQIISLDNLIGKTKWLIKKLENQEINREPETKIDESDYEVISTERIACEKEKEERERLLIELISKVDLLTQENWINYDLIEEEVSHGEYEYTLITQIKDLKNELKSELEMEREEIKKALDKSKEWRERQIKEITEQKDQQIEQLQNKIKELERQLNDLQIQEQNCTFENQIEISSK